MPTNAAPKYETVRVLDAKDTFMFSINNVGAVTGYYYPRHRGASHAFLRDSDGTITNVDCPGGKAKLTEPVGINDSGTIAGTCYVPLFSGFVRTSDGTFVLFNVGSDETNVSSINAKGVISGDSTDGFSYSYGFFRRVDGHVTTFDVSGVAQTQSALINDKNQIAGVYSETPGGETHGYLRDEDGTVTTFDPENQYPWVVGINYAGTIVGRDNDLNEVWHGFVRTPDGAITAFDAPDAGKGLLQGTLPAGINKKGEIVGEYYDANNVSHGFVRASDGSVTEFDVPKHGTVDTYVFGLNDEGEITGGYDKGTKTLLGYVRTP